MNRSLIILILFFSLPVLSRAHGDKLPISLSGIISDPSGKAVSGATISIEKNGQIIHSTETNAGGEFSIQMEGPLGRMDELKLKIEKKGYRSQQLVPMLCPKKNLEVELQKLPTPIPIMRQMGVNNTLMI